jgi:2C-methyl-D-erythritol 2,4-cyclodiphosphate synthase
MLRIGFGYDVHPLVPGRKLVLGGVEIPFEKGLEGHSDADVLLHAICDGLLGALGEGDIRRHFPNTDPQFIDSTVVAERPRIAPYISRMEERIAKTLNLSFGRVNVKATTSEGLGFIGEGRGIAAYAVVLISSKK